MHTPEKLSYGIVEAAKAVGIGRSTIYDEIKQKRLRAFKLRGRSLIHADDLKEWLDRHRRADA